MNTTLANFRGTSRWKIGLILFGAGFLGILSLLLTDLPTQNLPKVVTQQFTTTQLKLLVLVNPIIFLLIAVGIGTVLYQKTTLQIVPTSPPAILWDAILPGLLAGLLIVGVAAVFKQLIPQEFSQLNQANELGLIPRFLYGGITEEILLRFGLMTLFAWLLTKVMGDKGSLGYWIAISLAALLFGAGHLPALHLIIPSPSTWLKVYIIMGNTVAGLVFGWVYWRKSLVMAMLAHATAHVVLLTSEFI